MPALLQPATRTVRSRMLDSVRWDGYRPRADDIVIGTYSKCGTTWMQRIVSMLVFQSAAPRPIWESSPWPDMRLFGPVEPVLATAEKQTHRRFFKTHLPFDAVPVYEGVKFIHVGRDGRDAVMSLHNHQFNFSSESVRRFDHVSRNDPKFGDDFPLVPENPATFFADWLDGRDGQGDDGASFFHVENTWWAARSYPNILFFHYNDLTANLTGEMQRIADFLEIGIPGPLWPEIVTAAGFHAMKAQGAALMPAAQTLWDDGVSRFLHRGTNGRWQDVFSSDDLARYDTRVKTCFTPELARWVSGGTMAGRDD